MYSFLPSSLFNARFRFHLIHPHLIIQCKVSFSSHSSSSHYSMQGFVFISFILISLFNARFRFHHHFILLGEGGLLYILINYMIFEMRACFLFLFQNEYECGYMLKSIVFGSFYHPFQDGYKKFRKRDILSMASPGQDTSYLNHLLQSFLYARTVTKSWCSVGMFFDRYTNFKFINWYLDMTIWI